MFESFPEVVLFSFERKKTTTVKVDVAVAFFLLLTMTLLQNCSLFSDQHQTVDVGDTKLNLVLYHPGPTMSNGNTNHRIT